MWAQIRPNFGRHRPNLAHACHFWPGFAKLSLESPNFGPHSKEFCQQAQPGPHYIESGPDLANIDQLWQKLPRMRPNLGPTPSNSSRLLHTQWPGLGRVPPPHLVETGPTLARSKCGHRSIVA